MDNATAALQFRLDPCPFCHRRFTPADVEWLGDNGFRLRHACPQDQTGGAFLAAGQNLRMTVQNWNKAIRRYTNAKG